MYYKFYFLKFCFSSRLYLKESSKSPTMAQTVLTHLALVQTNLECVFFNEILQLY